MNNFNDEKIKELAQVRHDPAISIYLPMERAGDATLKNPIRIKNALKKVENELHETEYGARVTATMLTRLSELFEGYDFTQNQLDGLAIFLAGEYTQMVKLPYRFDEWVYVGNAFELRPLLRAYQNEMDFYVIALSRKNSRLFRGSKFNIVEIMLDNDVPTSFEEAMRHDDPEDQLQHQTISGADGGSTPVFHGHTESDNEKKNLKRFFWMLDEGIANVVSEHEKPFLLVGLEYLQPIYREASNLPNLLEFGLDKNPDGMRIGDLHESAWRMIEEKLFDKVSDRLQEYQQKQESGLSLMEITEISLAAAYGKVDKLLVEKTAQVWGRVDPNQNDVELNKNSKTDLLRFSVNQTLLNGGEVIVLDKEEAPSVESPAIAILRYQ